MKKILAIVVAMMMVMALSVSIFADDIDVSGMDVAFEWTEGKAAHDWWTAKDVFSADDYAKFVEALGMDGAVVEVAGNNPGAGGAMTNFNFDWDGHGILMAGDGQYPMGDFDCFASMDQLRADGKVPDTIDNVILQFNIYQDETDVTVSKVAVYVPAGAAPEAEAEAEETPAETEEAPAEAEAPAEETPAEAPAETEAEAPAAEETPAEAPAAETKAPATGLALAVVPAVMALAAVAVSKKH